ncbi:hypothetical protein C8J56DRAFT_1107399 [Mycena floridula]|nr:hypothetical protein C8J56DRAFT_1107399 [Mycena floridula]
MDHLPPSPTESVFSSASDSSFTPVLPSYRARGAGRSSLTVAHPYARLYAKKDDTKRRRIWSLSLEKSIFSAFEISTMGALQRRSIYTASLEAHIDKLHSQLLNLGFSTVPLEELEQFKGLSSKRAKGMVSNLQHQLSVSQVKLLELERANAALVNSIQQQLLTDDGQGSFGLAPEENKISMKEIAIC